MNALQLITVISLLVSTQAIPVKESSDVTDVFQKLVRLENLILKQDADAELNFKDGQAKVLSSFQETGESEEDFVTIKFCFTGAGCQ